MSSNKNDLQIFVKQVLGKMDLDESQKIIFGNLFDNVMTSIKDTDIVEIEKSVQEFIENQKKRKNNVFI